MQARLVSSSPRVTSRWRSPRLRYVYGIIASEKPETFDVAGVDDRGGEVFAVCHGGLAAVVGPSRSADYRSMARQQALRSLTAHQRVLEVVMERSAVLPVRFGTVLSDDAGVRRLLDQGAVPLASGLAEFSGRTQTEVLVTWRLEDLFRDIGAEPEIVRAKAEAAGQPPEHAAAARLAVGEMVQASLERRRAELQGRLMPCLRDVALDLAVNALMDDRMVLNVALLLDPPRREALDRLLGELDRRSEDRLTFRCVGPLPPYSFATVTVEVMDFASVDQARRLLGLEERATARDIRRAYRALAARRHPDVNAGQQTGAMATLNEAYALLTAYAGAAAPEDGRVPERAFAFHRAAVAKRLLISVVRQEAPQRAERRA